MCFCPFFGLNTCIFISSSKTKVCSVDWFLFYFLSYKLNNDNYKKWLNNMLKADVFDIKPEIILNWNTVLSIKPKCKIFANVNTWFHIYIYCVDHLHKIGWQSLNVSTLESSFKFLFFCLYWKLSLHVAKTNTLVNVCKN